MITEEITKLEELSRDFTQAIIDSKKQVDQKLILKQKDFNGLFAQLFYAAHTTKITSDNRAKSLFEFLGDKINSPNKEEYICVRDYVIEHFQKNTIQ